MHCLEVRGDFACFNRPELSVERVSYDVITPSAARSIFEAILWKPAIRWQIEKIEVLNPIRWISLRRNEVGSKISTRNVETAMREGRGTLGLYVDEDRQQRAGLFLRDVRYRLTASFELTDRAGPEEDAGKFAEMFRRRAISGQCVNQPYLGCREFSADFRLVTDTSAEPPSLADYTQDLGWMLYDFDFANRDAPRPLLFRPKVERGVIRVPHRDSVEVIG